MPYLGDDSPPRCLLCLFFLRALQPLFSLCYALFTRLFSILLFRALTLSRLFLLFHFRPLDLARFSSLVSYLRHISDFEVPAFWPLHAC